MISRFAKGILSLWTSISTCLPDLPTTILERSKKVGAFALHMFIHTRVVALGPGIFLRRHSLVLRLVSPMNAAIRRISTSTASRSTQEVVTLSVPAGNLIPLYPQHLSHLNSSPFNPLVFS